MTQKPDRIAVINPATGEAFADAPNCTKDELDRTLVTAAAAFADWSRDAERRSALLAECARSVAAETQTFAELLTREQGKPLREAIGEVKTVAMWLEHAAEQRLPVEIIQDDARTRTELHRRPIGVIGAITPWNYPLMLAVWKFAPALAAGNTVVLKPSQLTPLATLLLEETFRRILPRGVFNVVSGGDELGRWLVEHPLIQKVSFTGSIEAGRSVGRVAGAALKRASLELGGNDAAIVLDDVDPSKIVKRLFRASFENAGQICSGIKRLYVHEKVFEAIADGLAARAKEIKVGDGLAPETEHGPVQNRAQLARISGLVAEALQSGARARAGGGPIERSGFFFAPTILTDVTDEMSIVREEQFGPALPILSFSDLDDAIARANATTYGLASSIWTSDVERAARVTHRLEAGTVWINQHAVVHPAVPFGGRKSSGFGVENGTEGLIGYTAPQVVSIAKG